ncbi:MAG: regulatory iron-sulfur-containing complex subunit RicT [candidate division WOR-3 bacterium]
MDRKDSQEKAHKKKTTLEVSLVGSEFDRYRLDNAERYKPGEFLWIREIGGESEILVKVRGASDRPAEKSLASIRYASTDRVKALMINLVKGYLFASGHQDIRVAGGTLDTEKGHLIIKFVADEKQDLRHLGPKLAKILHVKVEFTQIGARDKARMVGGLGRCGLEMCCKRFLVELPSVTLTMARKQYLFAAPDKLSGTCGRLICCLRYEMEFYEEMAERLPALGEIIRVGDREGEVIEVNPIKGFYRIRFTEGGEEKVEIEENKLPLGND